MKSRIWIVMAVSALGICQPRMAAAQSVYQGAQSQGMFNATPFIARGPVQGIFGTQMTDNQLRYPVQSIFGPQPLGLSLEPFANRFGSRALVDGGMAAYSNPGGVYGPSPLAQQLLSTIAPTIFLPTEAAPAPPVQSPAPAFNVTEVQAAPQTAPQTNPAGNETEDTNQTAEGQNATPSAAPAFPYVTQSRARTPAAYASFDRPQSFNRSLELSDRLTRIARQKNMLAGQGIDVYLGDRVAVLKGVVRTSSDRSLLANVVGLEPEVQYVDNRLTTEGANSLSASRTGP